MTTSFWIWSSRGVRQHLACLPAFVAQPRVAGDDHAVPLLGAEDLDLVVGRLLAVGGVDRVAADERTDRDAFEVQLGVLGERGHHRREVAAADSLVETLDVLLEQAHAQEANACSGLPSGFSSAKQAVSETRLLLLALLRRRLSPRRRPPAPTASATPVPREPT